MHPSLATALAHLSQGRSQDAQTAFEAIVATQTFNRRELRSVWRRLIAWYRLGMDGALECLVIVEEALKSTDST